MSRISYRWTSPSRWRWRTWPRSWWWQRRNLRPSSKLWPSNVANVEGRISGLEMNYRLLVKTLTFSFKEKKIFFGDLNLLSKYFCFCYGCSTDLDKCSLLMCLEYHTCLYKKLCRLNALKLFIVIIKMRQSSLHQHAVFTNIVLVAPSCVFLALFYLFPIISPLLFYSNSIQFIFKIIFWKLDPI